MTEKKRKKKAKIIADAKITGWDLSIEAEVKEPKIFNVSPGKAKFTIQSSNTDFLPLQNLPKPSPDIYFLKDPPEHLDKPHPSFYTDPPYSYKALKESLHDHSFSVAAIHEFPVDNKMVVPIDCHCPLCEQLEKFRKKEEFRKKKEKREAQMRDLGFE